MLSQTGFLKTAPAQKQTHMSANHTCTELVLMRMAAIGYMQIHVYYNPYMDSWTRINVNAGMLLAVKSNLELCLVLETVQDIKAAYPIQFMMLCFYHVMNFEAHDQ